MRWHNTDTNAYLPPVTERPLALTRDGSKATRLCARLPARWWRPGRSGGCSRIAELLGTQAANAPQGAKVKVLFQAPADGALWVPGTELACVPGARKAQRGWVPQLCHASRVGP